MFSFSRCNPITNSKASIPLLKDKLYGDSAVKSTCYSCRSLDSVPSTHVLVTHGYGNYERSQHLLVTSRSTYIHQTYVHTHKKYVKLLFKNTFTNYCLFSFGHFVTSAKFEGPKYQLSNPKSSVDFPKKHDSYPQIPVSLGRN